MSTFTDWNGPQSNSVNNLRNSDLLALTKAYNEILTALSEKQDKLTIDDTLQSTSHPVENKAVKEAVDKLQAAVDAAEKEIAANKAASEEAVSALEGKAAEKAELESYKSSFEEYKKATDKALEEAKEQLSQLDEFFQYDEESLTVKKALKITSYLLESSYIDFRKMTAFRAPVVAVEGDEPAFILGMMSSDWEPSKKDESVAETVEQAYKTKAAEAFIKFVNTKSFDSLVSMSASYNGNDGESGAWKGALSATSSNASSIKDLRLRLLSGTSESSEKHVWLAIASGSWTAASTDFYQSLYFYATGINFYPVSSDGYKDPNGATHLIAEASLGNGLSASALSSDKVTDSQGNVLLQLKTVGKHARLLLGNDTLKAVKFYTRPYYKTSPIMSLADMKSALDEIGTVVAWSKYGEDGEMVDYPSNYHPCDVTEFTKEEYPELYELLGGKFPKVDYHLVKATYGKDLHDLPETAGQSLEYVIATLHGIKVYERLNDVPTSHHLGEPVIIRDTDPVTGEYEYYVMVKTADGWEDYSTEFDDYEKTIKSIASVLASLHGADVYSVYSEESDLPATAEEGQLAIIIRDGNEVEIKKFVDGEWESQTSD